MQDNRKFIRFNVALDAVSKRTSWLKPRNRYSVKDVSREGLKLGSREVLNQGDIVELELMVPGQKRPITAAGQVAWSHKLGESGYDIGLRFKTIKPEEKFELLDLAYNNWVKTKKSASK